MMGTRQSIGQISMFDTASDFIENTARQNAHLTYKYNTSMGRHGWLRLTPAYSVRMVESVLSELKYKPNCVLEPFSGTGTTELVCADRGIMSVAYDINPFLAWFAGVKTRVYDISIPYALRSKATEIVNSLNEFAPVPYPPIAHIERWWGQGQLSFLSKLKTGIWSVRNADVRDLLKVAFCRILISISNAAFDHVSTSFNDDKSEAVFDEAATKQRFIEICFSMAETLQVQPSAAVRIYNADSTALKEDGIRFDTVITSPPYPNRISYIRELRPYMYWLDYLSSADEASDLDWATIGGTWGTATSRLSSWKAKTEAIPSYILETADRIAEADNKSAGLMANYVLKYFDDMALHFQTVFRHIASGGTVHYIVGNSNFYGNTVPSERAYADMLHSAGFVDAQYRVVRKRNCNKALYEYLISAKKP
ncbi:MAG: DNA methyltransferase [Clostridia bacterium]|nr:DNA methyltransferase [Clostridia bacterium]